ncbi:Hypothetical predicted protein, partial [Olea europaea subsp. europaea]
MACLLVREVVPPARPCSELTRPFAGPAQLEAPDVKRQVSVHHITPRTAWCWYKRPARRAAVRPAGQLPMSKAPLHSLAFGGCRTAAGSSKSGKRRQAKSLPKFETLASHSFQIDSRPTMGGWSVCGSGRLYCRPEPVALGPRKHIPWIARARPPQHHSIRDEKQIKVLLPEGLEPNRARSLQFARGKIRVYDP